MKLRPRHVVEYAFLAFFVGLFKILPHRAALAVAWVLAALMHFVFRFRRKKALARIREVMGDNLPRKEAARIAWISFRNLFFNMVEIVRFPRLSNDWLQARIDCEELRKIVHEYRDTNQGFIVALVHAGNWDLAGLVAERWGTPGLFIARTQKNPLTNRLLNRMREQIGSEVVDRNDPSLVRKALRALKRAA